MGQGSITYNKPIIRYKQTTYVCKNMYRNNSIYDTYRTKVKYYVPGTDYIRVQHAVCIRTSRAYIYIRTRIVKRLLIQPGENTKRHSNIFTGVFFALHVDQTVLSTRVICTLRYVPGILLKYEKWYFAACRRCAIKFAVIGWLIRETCT